MKQSLGAQTIAYPLPVFVIGTYDHAGKPNAMVAAWGGICSSDPPGIAVSVRPSRYTYRNLMEKRAFTHQHPVRGLPKRGRLFRDCIRGGP